MSPGTPTVGAPEATVCWNRLPPSACNPASLTKLAMVSWPSCCAVAWPAIVAVTMPLWLTLTLVAVGGMVIAGVTRYPSVVTN